MPLTFLLYFLLPGWLRNAFLLVVSVVLLRRCWARVDGAARVRDRERRGRQNASPHVRRPRRPVAAGSRRAGKPGPAPLLKYWNFLVHSVQDAAAALHMPVAWSASNILLPIGISFFTFQGISYIVDIYRRDVPPARNVVDFGMYHTLFPQLIAGPIVRFGELQARVRHRPISVEDVHAGCSVSALRLARKSSLPTAWAYWRIACSAEIRTERVSDGVARFMPLLHPPFEEGLMVKANWAWPALRRCPVRQHTKMSPTLPPVRLAFSSLCFSWAIVSWTVCCAADFRQSFERPISSAGQVV